MRISISNQTIKGDPEKLPDLRDEWIVTTIFLIFLFPLMYFQGDRLATSYGSPSIGKVEELPLLMYDTGARAITLFDFSEVYDWPKLANINTDADWVRHLTMIIRVTFDLIIIAGVVQLFKIRGAVKDSILALPLTHLNAERLGNRATNALIEALKANKDDTIIKNAAKAAGAIGNPKIIPELLRHINHKYDMTRRFVVVALGQLVWHGAKNKPSKRNLTSAMDALFQATEDPNQNVRWRAVEALAGRRQDKQYAERIKKVIEDIASRDERTKDVLEAEDILSRWDKKCERPIHAEDDD